MILVDTSIWVEHLRRRHAGLTEALERGEVVVHPFVAGELALGGLAHRAEIIGLLQALPIASVASHEETMAMVDRAGLAGAGIGWVDAHLLASALIDRVPLWTLDRRLETVARKLGAAFGE